VEGDPVALQVGVWCPRAQERTRLHPDLASPAGPCAIRWSWCRDGRVRCVALTGSLASWGVRDRPRANRSRRTWAGAGRL